MTEVCGPDIGRSSKEASRMNSELAREAATSLEPARHLRLALAQVNVTVGDLAGNVERLLRDIRRAAGEGVDLVAFPELALTGYPPEDLLLKPGFVADNLRALEHLTAATRAFPGLTIVVGFADRAGD